MYKQLGYSVYRTVLEYYSASNGEPDEDAYGKCLFCLKLNGKVLMLSIPRVVCMGFVLVFFFRMRKIQLVVVEWKFTPVDEFFFPAEDYVV